MPYLVTRNVYREMAELGLVHPEDIQAELDRVWAWLEFTASHPGYEDLQYYLFSAELRDTVMLTHFIHPQLTAEGWRYHFDVRLPTGEELHIYTDI